MKIIIDTDDAFKRLCLTKRTKTIWELKQNKHFHSVENLNVSDMTFLAYDQSIYLKCYVFQSELCDVKAILYMTCLL